MLFKKLISLLLTLLILSNIFPSSTLAAEKTASEAVFSLPSPQDFEERHDEQSNLKPEGISSPVDVLEPSKTILNANNKAASSSKTADYKSETFVVNSCGFIEVHNYFTGASRDTNIVASSIAVSDEKLFVLSSTPSEAELKTYDLPSLNPDEVKTYFSKSVSEFCLLGDSIYYISHGVLYQRNDGSDVIIYDEYYVEHIYIYQNEMIALQLQPTDSENEIEPFTCMPENASDDCYVYVIDPLTNAVMTLNEYKSKYSPSNRVVTGVNYTVRVGNVTLPLPEYPIGSFATTTQKPCNSHGSCKWTYIDPTSGKSVYVFGRQCCGFARYVFYRCFGIVDFAAADKDLYHQAVGYVSPSNISENYLRSILGTKVKPGAHIRTNSGGGFQHSLVYMGSDDSYVYTYECNTDGRCGVTTKKRTWGEMVTYLTKTKPGISYIDMPNNYPDPCAHTYTTGHCTKCGALQPLQKDNITAKLGVYTTTASGYAYLRKDPYDTGVNFSNNLLQAFPYNKREVIVTGAVINGKGETWYKVTYGSMNGYIKAGEITFTREIAAEVMCSTLSVPANQKVGMGYHISGAVSSTNCIIVKARAFFRNGSTGAIVPNTTTAWYSVDANTLNLHNSSIDKALRFGRLPVGSFRYCIEIQTDKTVNGKTVHEFQSENFNVGQATVLPPTIVEIGADIGSKTFAIKGSGTLYYRVNETSWIQGSSVTISASSVIEAKAVSGNATSAITSLLSIIPNCNEPTISSTITAQGAVVTISADYGTTVYYQIDGGSPVKYVGAITVAKSCNVTAYAEQAGCTRSSTITSAVKALAPNKPTPILDTDANIADGTAMAFRWSKDILASSYTVTVKKNGVQWNTETVYVPQYAFTTNGAGQYDVTVVSNNVIGNSLPSNTITCTAHAPSIVTFTDYDGSVLSAQTVPYGKSATKPSTPIRKGYTFSGWSEKYTDVTHDLVVVAEYDINYYSVKFYDVNGTKLLATQDIKFNEAIDSASVEALVNAENGGRVFSGWQIVDADTDSNRDVDHIDSNMKLRAVTAWGNNSLPIFVDNLSATLLYDKVNGVFNGYRVSCNVSAADKKDINAKIIVTLLTVVDSGSDVCKMVAVKVDTINLTASSSEITWTGDVLCDGSSCADYIEISVVSVDENDRTGGLISETKRIRITDEATQLWSEWMTEEALKASGHTIDETNLQSKTQYSGRTNTKSTVTTSSSTPPAGYTLQADNSYWGNWSGWSDTPVSASSTRQVETQSVLVPQGYTEYRYGSWYNGSRSHFCGAYFSGLYQRYTDWSTVRYSKQYGDRENYCPYYSHYTSGKHIGYINYDGATFFWAQWLINGKNYYWEESRWVDTSYHKTQYRYRDYVGSYTYYKWDYGTWSDWTDSVLTDDNPSDLSYEVKTRKLYRYIIFDANDLPDPVAVQTTTISGTLEDINNDLAERHATIFVYKSLNSDPTESQLEYIGQTTLGENGSYTFTFVTKEIANAETGDFVVALAIEGSDGLINVGMVTYDRPAYTVTFATEGSIISTQQVQEGGTAIAPEAPVKEGYTFTGWSRNITNVSSNLTVIAQYKPKDCSVVFVDYLNQICEIHHFDYGAVLTVPPTMENPKHEGYTFSGWSCGNESTVKGDMIVSAVWEINTYTVTFYDETEKIAMYVQTIPHGGSATPPKTLTVSSDKVFIGWSEANPWWNIKNDVSVYPVVIYSKTTAAPLSNVCDVVEGIYEEIVFTSEENATIYYTIDGSEPVPSHVGNTSVEGTTYIYTGPIKLETDAIVRAKAVCTGKNDSRITDVIFVRAEELANENLNDTIELKSENVVVDQHDTVSIQIDLLSNPKLNGFGFYVKADPSIFHVDFDTEKLTPNVKAGDLCKNSESLIVEEYDEILGWHIVWIGEPSALTKGTAVTLTLVAGANIEKSSYPITVGYITGSTFGTGNDFVTLDTVSNVTITANPHSHDYRTETTPSTCVAAGQIVYTCKVCGKSHVEAIAATGHSYNYKATTNPTTSTTGILTGTCSKCSGTTTVTLPKLNTTDYAKTVTKSATCTATGTDSYKWNTTTYGNFSFTATTAALGHSYTTKVTAPTCTAQGYTTHTCSRCSDSYKDSYTNAIGHSYTSKVTTAATCTSAGVKTYTCSKCSHSYTEAISATGHTVVTDKAVAATCTTAGKTEGSHCSVCNAIIKAQTTIAATGHSYTSKVTTSATCTNAGVKTYTCSKCSHSYTEAIAATGHTVVTDKAVAATCTAAGKTEGSHCSVCNAVIKAQTTIAATGHSYTSKVTTAATCTKEGVKTFTCSKCSHSYTEAIAATGHTVVTDKAVAATCTTVGKTEGSHCSVCNAVIKAQTAIPATGHSYTSKVTTAATCTKEGVKTFACSKCSHSYTEAIAATDHTVVTDKAVAATCTTAGKTEGSHCSVCNVVIKAQETVPALGHDYTSEVTAPTCTEQGYTTHTCSRCSDSYKDSYTNATGHSYSYTDKGDTHEAVCGKCSHSFTEAHSYTDNTCVCGAVEVLAPITDSSIVINHSLNLASDISINYAVKASLLSGYDSFRMEVQVPIYNRNALTGFKTVTIEPVLNGSYYYFTMKELTAIHMNDILVATLHMNKGKQEYVSKPDSYSVATYALGLLNQAGMAQELKVLCADLLRYGAAAQTYKNYRTDALATASMTEAHKAYWSDLGAVTFGNTNTVYNDIFNPMITWAGKTLNLGSKVVVKFVFNAGAFTGDVSKLTLRMIYQGSSGAYRTVTLSNPTVYNEAKRMYAFDFDGLMAAELRTALSVAVYNGDIQLSQTMQYSADTYGNSTSGTLLELCKALFAYSDSAKAYFTK